MKIALPLVTRHVWIVFVALLVLDLAVAGLVCLTLYRQSQRVMTVEVDGLVCRAYSPTLLGVSYLVARCVRSEEP